MGARQLAALLAVALWLSATVGAAGVGSAGVETAGISAAGVDATGVETTGTGAATDATAQSQRQQVTPDTVVMDVEVYENGTADWSVIYRTRLDDPQTTAAFRGYRADVENNSTKYSQQFVSRMTDTIRSAERATGREMEGRDYGVRAEIREFPQRYGVVVYSFKWEGFAATDGERLRVGDALSGLFLNEKTRLLVSWPESYEVAELRPAPDERRDRTAVWTGPTDFAADRPRLVLAPPSSPPFELPWQSLAVGLLVVTMVGVGAAGLWIYRERDDEVGDVTDDPPEELLSNEERVVRLLERRGGRVKQKAVVDELGWTEAKTSQVVGSLRERGEIESFRLGRENVLALPQERRES